MKSTLLLATALFLISAPAPDAGDIAELSSNFIVPENVPGLLADERKSGPVLDKATEQTSNLSPETTHQEKI